MRLVLIATLTIAAATPAFAQLSGSTERLNDLNDRMATQNQIRSLEQRQQLESSQTRMQIQRNEMFRAPPGPPAIVPPRR